MVPDPVGASSRRTVFAGPFNRQEASDIRTDHTAGPN